MATATITKDTIIGEILDLDQSTAPYFLEMGMQCLGCPAARGEPLEQARAVHGVDPEELVKKAAGRENVMEYIRKFGKEPDIWA